MVGVSPAKGLITELLSTDDVRKIHDATLEVLNNVGVKIFNQEALKYFGNAGAVVDYKTQLVKIPSWLVKDALQKTPHRVRLYSRKPDYDMTLGTGVVYFASGYGAPFTIDLETRERRPVSLRDLERCMGLYEALDNIHTVLCEQMHQDVMNTAKNLELYITRAILCNTRKHAIVEAYSAQGVQGLVRMAAAIMNCAEEDVGKRPIITGQLCATAPLQIHGKVAEALIEFSRYNIPVSWWSLPSASASAPATLAGTLVIQNADVLAGLVLAQIVNPGVPILYGAGFTSIMDQRYGCFVTGGPELSILSAATTPIARYYGVPHIGGGGATESKVEDEQAAYEKAMTLLYSSMAGADIVHGVSGWLESVLSSSLSQAVIADEIASEVIRYLQGVQVNEETLAVDAIQDVGPGGTFLAHKHTRKHFLKESWMPKLADRQKREQWEALGAKPMPEVAREKVRKILAEHKEVVDKDTKTKLDSILRTIESS